jgi:hypothetical protein
MAIENDFERIAKTGRETSFISELWAMICDQKKYWMIPIIAVLLLLGLLVLLSGTAAAPFIYTLF